MLQINKSLQVIRIAGSPCETDCTKSLLLVLVVVGPLTSHFLLIALQSLDHLSQRSYSAYLLPYLQATKALMSIPAESSNLTDNILAATNPPCYVGTSSVAASKQNELMCSVSAGCRELAQTLKRVSALVKDSWPYSKSSLHENTISSVDGGQNILKLGGNESNGRGHAVADLDMVDSNSEVPPARLPSNESCQDSGM